MQFFGSVLSFPISTDVRGTFRTTNDPHVIVEQSIQDLIETRQGERRMVPDYGMPDFLFNIIDAGFGSRFAFALSEQIEKYLPKVTDIRVTPGRLDGGHFVGDVVADPLRVSLLIQYRLVWSNVPGNMVHPIFQLLRAT